MRPPFPLAMAGAGEPGPNAGVTGDTALLELLAVLPRTILVVPKSPHPVARALFALSRAADMDCASEAPLCTVRIPPVPETMRAASRYKKDESQVEEDKDKTLKREKNLG